MPSRKVGRRVRTVLFLDIVGSTRVASDLGDRRWRELLTRFRRTVRANLKRHGGREVDTAGDGFLATFDEPAGAIQAAIAITGGVQEHGIEVRSGIHTGECEVIEGSFGGIAVHIASRVISLAGTAEVLVTSTVKDLVAGSHTSFEDFSAHELKGVPGTWQLFAVREVDGKAAPKPMAASESLERLERVEHPPLVRRRNLMGAGAAALAVLLVVVFVAIRDGEEPATTQATARPITMLRIDPETNDIGERLRDQYYSFHLPGSLWTEQGTLWQATEDQLIPRDPATAEPRGPIEIDSSWAWMTLGFGSAWVAHGPDEAFEVARIDLVSGRTTKVFELDGQFVDIGSGNGAVWVITLDGILYRIDPLKNQVTGTYETDAFAPGVVVPLGGYVWICDCEVGEVHQFDPQKEEIVKTLPLQERGFLVGIDTSGDRSMWLLDPEAATLTPVDPESGETGRSIGIGSDFLTQAQVAFDSIWIAGGAAVYRVDLQSLDVEEIDMPPDFSAGSIAADPATGVVWVGNCGCPTDV